MLAERRRELFVVCFEGRTGGAPDNFAAVISGDDDAVPAMDQGLEVALLIAQRTVVQIGVIAKHRDPQRRQLGSAASRSGPVSAKICTPEILLIKAPALEPDARRSRLDQQKHTFTKRAP